MAGKKSTKKQKDSDTRAGEIAEQLEHAFLAGLGALSDARKEGAKKFDTLVKEGEKFRDKTTSRTESLIDDVQDAIRDMADDAQSKATGLLDQVRGKSRLNKLQSAFDTRVADAMDRLNVPSKNDIDAINKKLNKIIRLLDDLKQQFSVTKQWQGDSLMVKGKGVSGHLKVDDSHFELNVSLGFALKLMEGPIRSVIERTIDEELA